MTASAHPMLWYEPSTKPKRAPVVMRPYQQQALKGIDEAFKISDTALLVMATGTGKTVVFSDLIRRHSAGRVLVLARLGELVHQAADKIEDATGLRPAIEMADDWSDERVHKAPVVVSSVQTQNASNRGAIRFQRFAPHEFALVVADEAHQFVSPSCRRVLDWYCTPGTKVLGVTATPNRHDEKALGLIFKEVAYKYELSDAITDGYLVEPKAFTAHITELDFTRCKTKKGGDFTDNSLESLISQEAPLHRIADTVLQVAGLDQTTLVFTPELGSAELLTEIFNRHESGCARWVHGKTPKDERRQLFADYRAGSFPILVNVGVVTHGHDYPIISCIALARPSKSESLVTQMIGRGTRPLPGIVDGLPGPEIRRAAIAKSDKPFLTVIDFSGNCGRHKLVNAFDVLGGKYDDDVIERAKANATKKQAEGRPASVMDELRKAVEQLQLERDKERERRRHVIGRTKFTLEAIDMFDRLDIRPERECGLYHRKPLSEKMAAMLKRNGADPTGLSYTHAKQLIGAIIEHPERLPCTRGQAWFLHKHGHKTNGLNKATASELIDRIKNGGRRE